jgi:hypothetical protein
MKYPYIIAAIFVLVLVICMATGSCNAQTHRDTVYLPYATYVEETTVINGVPKTKVIELDTVYYGRYLQRNNEIEKQKQLKSLIEDYKQFQQDSVYLETKIVNLFSGNRDGYYELTGDISYRYSYLFQITRYRHKYLCTIYRHGGGFREFFEWLDEKYNK